MWFSSSRAARRLPIVRRRLGVERLEDRCQPSAGVLDPTFGSGGTVTPAVTADAVLVQPSDGRILVAGSSGTVMALARYNPNGTLDASFGSSGKETTAFAGVIARIAEYPQAGTANDGKIVAAAAGSVARFNANGTVDTTFGTKGVATLPWSSPESSLVIGSDGKIIVAQGGTLLDGGSTSFTIRLTRLNANGGLDTTFATQGTFTATYTIIGPAAHQVVSSGAYLVVQPDGKIVLDFPHGAMDGEGWLMERLTASGALDSTFSSQATAFASPAYALNGAAAPEGLASYPATDSADAGKFLAVGYTYQEAFANGPPGGATVLARYNADGTFDTTFGQGGKVITPNGGTVSDVAIEPDGKAILVGAKMQRYNTDGTLDTTFGSSGFVSTAYNRVAIQPDGRIDAISTSTLARYLASAPQIGSFTAGANPVPSGSSETLTVSNVADGNPASAVTQVEFYYIDGTGAQQVLGYGTQTSPGVWTLTFSVGMPAGSYSVFAQAEDSYGVLGDPIALSLQVM